MRKGIRTSEAEIKSNVYYLHDYHKYRLSDGTKNPKFDSISGRILDLKSDQISAINRFGKEISDYLAEFVDTDLPIALAFVPSSNPSNAKKGLQGVIKILSDNYCVVNDENLLIRKVKIEKATEGGDRSKKVHMKSIISNSKIDIGKQIVVLIDDVATTNNSISACEDILYDAGAALVICICVAHTVLEGF